MVLSRLFGGTGGPASDAHTLSAADFKARYDAGDVAVVDVRTPGEYAGGHVAGAHLADMMAPDFDAQIDALGLDPAQPVYLYCRSGNRSGKAAERLRARGFAQATNVGGFEALTAAGLPVAR
ncbi:MAG: rhodanese-like domain-containing protein [Rubricoccaceae bacterium]